MVLYEESYTLSDCESDGGGVSTRARGGICNENIDESNNWLDSHQQGKNLSKAPLAVSLFWFCYIVESKFKLRHHDRKDDKEGRKDQRKPGPQDAGALGSKQEGRKTF